MHVVILAAGIGSRLGDRDLPKTLTQLANGETILGQQLKFISRFISLAQVIIVVGYHEEMIMGQYPQLSYIHNPHYAEENTSKSLLKAISHLDDDVLWINGDVVFHPTVLEAALKNPKTCMVVNQGEVGEEEVKYRADAQGRILEVSKQVASPQGEALGINLFMQPDLENLKWHLESCHPSDYFEKAIEGCIQEGTGVWAIPVDSRLCVEIDFPEDLAKANGLIAKWTVDEVGRRWT